MIHITEEGGRKKVGLNLYCTRGGFVVAWVWYYTATHELKGWRFRLRMHIKPRILWSVDSCNVIANPPQRTWAELTDKEILSISNENYTNNKGSQIEFARAVLRNAQEPAEKKLTERYAREMKSRNWISFNDWVREISPPQRTWVGLTDEEILAINMSTVTKLIDEPIVCDTDHNIIQLGKAIEAKLKHKNTRGQE
jgi:hypothetical protein